MQYIQDPKQLKEHVKQLHRTHHGAAADNVVVPEDKDSTINAVQR